MANLTSVFNGSAFDATQVEPATEFAPIPRGRYLVCVEKSEMKTTRDSTGQYLELAFKVLDGEHNGRVVFARLNLVNHNPKATEIAYRELSAICRACGAMQISDSAELHNRPMVIQVELESGQDKNGNPRQNNVIKGYYSTGAASPAAPPAQPARAPAAPAAPSSANHAPSAGAPRSPWKRASTPAEA